MTFLESVTSHLIFSPEEKNSLVEEIVPQFPLCVEKIYHSLSLMSKTGRKVERVPYLTLDLLPSVNDGVSPGIHFHLSCLGHETGAPCRRLAVKCL